MPLFALLGKQNNLLSAPEVCEAVESINSLTYELLCRSRNQLRPETKA